MKLTSPAFHNYGSIPSLYTCDDQGLNPPLAISDVPEQSNSLVLIVDDPDAPTGTFTHWVVWNIPPQTKEITEDSVPPQAVEGRNSAGELGWTPPCPPSGTHNYRFLLWALSRELRLPEGTDRETVEKEIEDSVLDRAELVGHYERDMAAVSEVLDD